jgi:hypothetical protein
MIYFAVDQPRFELLAHYQAREWGRPLRDRMRQMSYAELFDSRSIPRGAWIFSGLDALTPAELGMAARLQSALRDCGLPVLNPASETLDRYSLLRLLHGAGRNDFQAHRADGPLDGLRFPVFVREADKHTGSLTPLLHDRRALRRAMAYLWMRGLPRRHLLVVEFCQTASPDGLYRKYSLFRIGDAFIPRYLHIGSEWMVKNATSYVDENSVREQMAYLLENPHAAWAREVFELAHIDYGRMDYGIRDGRPQLWEINVTPVLAGNPDRPSPNAANPRARNLLRPAREHAQARIREAFEHLDPGPVSGDYLRVEFPPELVAEARRERREIQSIERRRRRIDRLAAAPGLRAVGPLLRRTLRG